MIRKTEMMTKARLTQFLLLLDEIVNERAPVLEKRAAILDVASESDRTNLEEFSSWFEATE